LRTFQRTWKELLAFPFALFFPAGWQIVFLSSLESSPSFSQHGIPQEISFPPNFLVNYRGFFGVPFFFVNEDFFSFGRDRLILFSLPTFFSRFQRTFFSTEIASPLLRTYPKTPSPAGCLLPYFFFLEWFVSSFHGEWFFFSFQP